MEHESSLRDSVDSSDNRYELPEEDAIDGESGAMAVDETKTTQEIMGEEMYRRVGDAIYRAARQFITDDALCCKATGCILDAHARSGPQGVAALCTIAASVPLAQEEVRRCVASLGEMQREYHDLLFARCRVAVRARHPPRQPDRIAAELATSLLRQGTPGEAALLRLLEHGHEDELDVAIARTAASLPPSASSPILAPATAAIPSTNGSPSSPLSPLSPPSH